MIHRPGWSLPLAILAGCAALAACSTTDRPPAGAGAGRSSSSASSSASSSSGGTDSGSDAGGDGSTTDPCTGQVQSPASVAVDELVRSDSVPPPLGGMIGVGTYSLTELKTYGGNPDAAATTGAAARITLYVTDTTMTWVESRGPAGALPPDQIRSATYTLGSTAINLKAVCPPGADTSVPYTAAGAGLALNVSSTRREVYVKR